MRNVGLVIAILSMCGMSCSHIESNKDHVMTTQDFRELEAESYRKDLEEKRAKKTAYFTVTPETKSKCQLGDRNECMGLLYSAEKNEIADDIFIAALKLCVENDEIQVEHCYKLVEAATIRNDVKSIEHGASIGCKYLEGRLCSLLFSLQKAKGNKEIALKILPLAVTLTKDECEHGFSDSCSEAEQLSAKCYADSKDCKELKLYLKKTQIDAKTNQEKLAREEQFKKKIISLEEQKIENARRAEERRVWSDLANELGKNLSKAGNSYGNNRIRCTSNTYAGTTFTNCD
jgi:hypothetical protein